MSRKTYRAGVVALLLLVGGCAGGSNPSSTSAAASATATPAAATVPASPPATSATPSTGPSPSPRSAFNTRCDSAAEPFADLTLKAKGMTIVGATIGSGTDAAVLLHQHGGDGICGGAPLAESLAKYGSMVVLIDLCGYGKSRCANPKDWRQMVALPVAWARDHGAQRVTLVGASAGGSIATNVAASVKADGVVDLSGPIAWQGKANLRADARTLTMPALFAYADVPDKPAKETVAGLLDAVPAGEKRLVTQDFGHGWDLAAPGSRARAWVLAWVKGDYAE